MKTTIACLVDTNWQCFTFIGPKSSESYKQCKTACPDITNLNSLGLGLSAGQLGLVLMQLKRERRVLDSHSSPTHTTQSVGESDKVLDCWRSISCLTNVWYILCVYLTNVWYILCVYLANVRPSPPSLSCHRCTLSCTFEQNSSQNVIQPAREARRLAP